MRGTKKEKGKKDGIKIKKEEWKDKDERIIKWERKKKKKEKRWKQNKEKEERESRK